MIDTLSLNPFTGIVLTLFFYLLGAKLNKKWPNPLFTPLIFAILCVMGLLLITDISYDEYMIGGQYFHIWVTPATVALAIKLERNYKYLKENYLAILSGIFVGVLFHTMIILGLSILFEFNGELFATLYPKSVTTAVALGVSESLGGIVSLTVAIVVFTGILGAVIAPTLFKITKITHPVAQGIAIGSSSHAMGTTKAIELGEVQGAMSGLAIVVTGVTVVVFIPLAEMILTMFF